MISGPDSNAPDREWERADLLRRAWMLDAQLEAKTVSEMLSALPDSELLREPELGFLLVRNWRRIGEREKAYALVRQLAEPCARLGNTRLARRRTFQEGGLEFEFGHVDRAKDLWLEVLDRSMHAKDDFTESMALSGLGIINSLQCRHAEALALYQRSLVVSFTIQRRDVAIDFNSIATAYREMGFPDEADANFQRSMAVSADAGDIELHAYSGVLRAQLMAERGETGLATECADRHYRLLEGQQRGIDSFRDADMLQIFAKIARLEGRLADARTFADRALARASRPGMAWILADVWRELAHIELAERRADAARAAAEESARIFRTMGADLRAQSVLEEVRAAGGRDSDMESV